MGRPGGRIRLYFEGDTSSLDRSTAKATGDVQKYGRAGKEAAKGLDKLSKETRDADRQTRNLGGSLKKAAAFAVGAATAYVGISAAKGAVDTTTTLAKTTLGLAKNFGLSAKEASAWAAVATSREVDGKQLTQSFGTLAKNIEQARAGSEGAIESFKALGLTQEEIKQSNPRDVLFDVADAMGKTGAGTQRTAAAMKLFGKGWQTVVPILRDGSGSLKENLDLADKYGATFSGGPIKSMSDLISTQRELKIAQLGLQVQFTKEIAPGLLTVMRAFIDARVAVAGWVDDLKHGRGAVTEFGQSAIQWITNAATNAFNGLMTGIHAVGGAFNAFIGWTTRAGKNIAGFVTSLLPVKLAAAVVAVGVSNLVRGIKILMPAIEGTANVLRTAFGVALKSAGIIVHTFLKTVGNLGSVVGDVVGLVSNLLRGDWRGAWDNAKKLVVDVWHTIADVIKGAWTLIKHVVSGGISVVKSLVKNGFGAVKGVVKNVATTLGDLFSGAWDRIKNTFKDGANAVLGFVQKIADVINLIPGIPDINVPTIGDDGEKGRKGRAPAGVQGPVGADERYSGGPITRPMAIVGEEAPQHHEWVIATNPKYRKNNIAYWMQAGRDLGVPGFLSGGDIAGVVGRGASYFVDKLPKPELPGWLGGLGTQVISGVADYIRSGFQEKKFGSLSVSPGVLGFTGAPANMKQLGNPGWVDGHTLAVAAFLAKKFGLSISSSYRTPAHNAAVGGVANSLHTHGSLRNPGAFDFVPPSSAALAWAQSHIAGLEQAMIHDAGSGLHLHLGFFAKGGKIPWDKLVGSSWDNDELATLAHLAGMSNPGLMAQIAQGESSGNPKAVGHDEGGTEGLGLWQITTGYNDELIAKYGGRQSMFNPLLNARAAADLLASSGLGAWYAAPTGPRGKVDQGLAQKIRGAMAGKPVGDGGAVRAARAHPGRTGKSGGTEGPFGRARKGERDPREIISLPGMQLGEIPEALKGLSPGITSLFTAPGMSREQRFGASDFALELAGETEGADDDRAVLGWQLGASQRRKQAIQKELYRLNKRLGERLTNKQRARIFRRREALLGELSTVQGRIGSAREGLSPDEDQPSAMDFASRDLALAELTPDLADDRAARERQLKIAEEQLDAALKTADPRDDIEAAQNLKSIRETLESTNEILRQQEEFQRERLELDKKFAALAETQGPAVLAAWVAWVDGAMGGPLRTRDTLPATASVAAAYQ